MNVNYDLEADGEVLTSSKVSTLIGALQKLQDKHGDLDVVYGDDRGGWACPVLSVEVNTHDELDDAPEGPAIYLNI